MLKNISPGMYYPGNSVLHRLQARTKLLTLFLIISCLIIAAQRQWHFAPYVAVVVLGCIGIVLAGVSFREIGRRMWLLLLLVVIGGIPLLFTTEDNSKPFYTIAPLHTTYALLYELLTVCSIIAALAFLLSLSPISRLIGNRFRRFRGLAMLVLFVSLIAFWLISGNSAEQQFFLGPFVITDIGVWDLVTIFVVLLVLYLFALLLTMTTTPVALVEGMTILLAPLRRLKLPVDDFALMSLLALCFISTLVEEARRLMAAQVSRGADITRGTVRERLQNLAMFFVPMIQGSLRRAEELATALEARGYEANGQQTLLHETSLGRLDYAVLSIVALVMIAALLL